MPKILLNACMYTKKPNGNGVYIKEAYNRLCKKLYDEKIQYTCYTYCLDGLNNKSNLKLIKIPFTSQNSFNRALGLHRIFWNVFILPFIARKYDMVYSFSNHGSPFIKTQIITIHDLICFEFPNQNKLQYYYNKYLLRHIINASKKIIAISEFTKTQVVKHFNIEESKVVVIYNGCDHIATGKLSIPINIKKYLSELTGNKKFYLSVGATYPHKNVVPLIKAMCEMDNDHVLIITGQKNKYFRQLKLLVDSSTTKKIILLEYVDRNFLAYLYSKCVANVYISLNEGFGFPPMEAAFYNKISLISSCGALPEIYCDAAYYVNPYSVEDIKKALLLVASPEFDIESYQKKYSHLLDNYTWENTASKIIGTIITTFCLKNKHSSKTEQFG